MKNKMFFAVAILITLTLTACTPTPLPEQDVSGTPTSTTSPTPTETPIETATPTEAPEVTPQPDPHYCTVIDTKNNREYKPTLTNGEYIFFLPGATSLDHLLLSCHLGTKSSVNIGETTFTEDAQTPIVLSKKNDLRVSFADQNGAITMQRYTFVFSSTNILCLDINEDLGKIDDMHEDEIHETYCYGSLSYFSTEEKFDCTSYISLKGRGNATWTDEKKGYALKFYDSQEYSKKNPVNFAGLGTSSNWVLIANHRDRTLLRNALAQTLAAQLGMTNAVKFVFVDLYMNGEYLGLYTLMEKIEIGKDQVNIADGGYLLEFDNYRDDPQIKLRKSGLRVTINAPDNLADYTAIEKLLNEAETALTDSNGYNRRTGKYWYDYIDIHSFAILWMVREYTMDYDANVNFRFYYDPADGKFHGGPAWDFDNSMARSADIYADPQFALIESGDRNPNCWLTKLMQFDAFRQEIVNLYQQHSALFTTTDSNSIYALAHQYQAELAYSIQQNFQRWEHQLAYPNWNMPSEPTYEGHFEILTTFLKERNLFWEIYIPQLTA